TFPSSQRRGGCAERSEGADGVVRPAQRFAKLTTPALCAALPLRRGQEHPIQDKSQSKRDEPRVSVQRVEQAGYRNLAAGSRRGAKEAGNDRSNSQDQRRNGTPVDPIGIRISALGIKQAGEVQVLSANYPIITDKNTGNSAHQTGIADEPREDIGAH